MFGAIIFEGLSFWQLALLLAAYALAFVIKGVFGYGAILPMILMGSFVMPPHQAIILAGLVNLASQVVLVPDGLKYGNHCLAGRMILFIIPAVIVGVLMFRLLEPAALQFTVGFLLLLILLAEGAAWQKRVLPFVKARQNFFSGAAALIAGLLSGLVGAGAMIFLSVYLHTVITERLALRGTIILIVTAMLAWRMLLLVWADFLNWDIALEALILLPVAVLFIQIGRTIAQRLSNDIFFRAYRIFMIFGSVGLMLRGAVQ
ncbi:sulfite exporter TauE/SafE family protein [Hoeflea sp. IMCC20628]|uniref:sulfite exporter TauE/SafE family protein n=1 Tax=Hoeflea sp. IMCC20628 TaxID=1620421 RepID=UPI0018CDEE91|nr:sulfite exporter TauE/SafE family protein [Hoeflea sp. IMCC20628]